MSFPSQVPTRLDSAGNCPFRDSLPPKDSKTEPRTPRTLRPPPASTRQFSNPTFQFPRASTFPTVHILRTSAPTLPFTIPPPPDDRPDTRDSPDPCWHPATDGPTAPTPALTAARQPSPPRPPPPPDGLDTPVRIPTVLTRFLVQPSGSKAFRPPSPPRRQSSLRPALSGTAADCRRGRRRAFRGPCCPTRSSVRLLPEGCPSGSDPRVARVSGLGGAGRGPSPSPSPSPSPCPNPGPTPRRRA